MDDRTLRYGGAATIWQDGIPLGNGRQGALLYGGTSRETVLLNHENLWLPVTEQRPLRDTAWLLPEVRQLAAEGRYGEIPALWYAHSTAYPEVDLHWPNPFLPAGELHIHWGAQGGAARRELNMSEGAATVSWEEQGVGFTRTSFVSRGEDAVVVVMTSTEPRDIERLWLQPVETGGQIAWDGTPIDALVDFAWEAEDNLLRLSGRFQKQVYGPSYGILCRVCTDGAVQRAGRGLSVGGATSTVLLLRVYDPAQWQREGKEEALFAIPADAGALLGRHAALHRALFERCVIDLCGEEGFGEDTTDGMVARARRNGAPDTALVQALTDFGRYLFISSTGDLPANLQGVWNGDYCPPWQCDYTMDENIQMNHWLALPGNLTELTAAYFSLFEGQLPQWRENARCLFGCGGVLAPIKSTVDALSHHQNRDWSWPIWTAGAGWIAALFYEHYLFTGDTDFLRARTVPLLGEIARFYADYFQVDDTGRYCIPIGISPENTPGGRDSMLAPNPTMEFAIAKEVLTHLAEAARVLQLPPEDMAHWENMLDKLPAYQVNGDGALKEWMHPEFADNYHHRHQSHLYPLFPGLEARALEDGDLLEACRVAVEKRLVVGLESQTGWSLMHMANLFARLGSAERAWECLCLETERMTGPNLFTHHNHLTDGASGERAEACFQIDANLGWVGAVQEMLLFSLPGRVDLLPCLPGQLPRGRVAGMRCRGGVTVDFSWDTGRGDFSARLVSDRDQTITVACPYFTRQIDLCKGQAVTLRP